VASMRKQYVCAATVAALIAGGGGATAAQAASQAPRASAGGAVYTETNAPDRNEVIAFRRGADGRLHRLGTYATGGKGTGEFENTDSMVVVGSSAGQSSPVDLGGGQALLFAANPGSDDISVFRIHRDGRLRLVARAKTGEERPTSLTVRNGLLYAMNSAGDSNPGVAFCLGGEPTITGFRVSATGRLARIPDSTRRLSTGAGSGCTQITFNPAGNVLLVSQFTSNRIDAFTIGADGRPSAAPVPNPSNGLGPFGLNFDNEGRLLTTDDGLARVGQGAVATYAVGGDGHLSPIGAPVPNGETDTCWIIPTPDDRYAFVTSFGPEPFLTAPPLARRGTVSSYRLRDDGTMQLRHGVAARLGVGAADIAMTRDGRYLYALNTIQGTVTGWRIARGGGLVRVSQVHGIPTNRPGPMSGGLAAWDRSARR